ncbi:4-hydroxy-3-methylbut-2-enyl diphosphate reductase [candidate division TA06 bacterium]|uniref:4-hydroxy-3-methylbut-2-enyl diphosphate reductase n=1 Tax=candidate division TA06 bacterium TaxID=2250710 RepID=A0A933ID53_UNCT6|nr:4-hydroxy-3-methylbut-2-enyl diphosphate reductase [candidate division TA06 bacterium]
MKIKVAQSAGFCFGVKRAVNMAFEIAQRSKKPVYTLGPIIHNPQVVAQLEACGVKAVKDLSRIKSGTVIIRSHGVHPRVIAGLMKKGITIVDATCPFVTKAQKATALLKEEGRQVVIVGEAEHPEVIALKGYAGKNSVVYNQNNFKVQKKLGVLAQTTLSADAFISAVSALSRRTEDLHAINTICQATQIRQQDTMRLANDSDVTIVVGGRNSANTSRLLELCRKVGRPAHHVETERELNAKWFQNCTKTGVTAGASTPDSMVKKVVERIRELTDKKRRHRAEVRIGNRLTKKQEQKTEDRTGDI